MLGRSMMCSCSKHALFNFLLSHAIFTAAMLTTGILGSSTADAAPYLDGKGVGGVGDGPERAGGQARVGPPGLELHAPGGLQGLRGAVARRIHRAHLEGPVACALECVLL